MPDRQRLPNRRPAETFSLWRRILQITRRALLNWAERSDRAGLAAARAEVELILREEFADIARTTLAEIRREDG